MCFSKEPEKKTTCSRVVRKMLRFFRAGIEASVFQSLKPEFDVITAVTD